MVGEDHQQNDDIALNIARAGVDNGVDFDDPVDAVVKSDDDDDQNVGSADEDDDDDAEEIRKMIHALISVLQQRHRFPARQRDGTIMELVRHFHFCDDDDDQNVDDNTNPDSGEDDDDNDEAEEITRMINTLLLVLQRCHLLSARQRDGKIVELVRYFHTELKDDIHDMITDQTYGENYAGLDANRDTEAEVETALRSYPENLERRKTTVWRFNHHDDFDDDLDDNDDDDDDDEEEIGGWMEDDHGNVPIYCLTHVRKNRGGWFGHNIKAIPFMHLFAQLAIEFNSSFDDYEDKETRGGLLITITRGGNVLQELVRQSDDNTTWDHTLEQVDSICFTQLARLRESRLLTKHDVVHFELVYLVHESSFNFLQQRFVFLTEWNPESLLSYRRLSTYFHAANNSIEGFRVVCDSIIRYYPKKRGIIALFENVSFNSERVSVFGIACENFGREQVIDIIESTLTRYSATVPLQTADALISAAMDDRTHLDGVYSILRRQPDVLIQQLLLPAPAPHGDAGSQYHTTNHKKRRRWWLSYDIDELGRYNRK